MKLMTHTHTAAHNLQIDFHVLRTVKAIKISTNSSANLIKIKNNEKLHHKNIVFENSKIGET